MSTPRPEPNKPDVRQEMERMPEQPPTSPPSAPPDGRDPAANQDDAPTIISKTISAGSRGSRNSYPNLLRGRKLAHFELLEPIGVGGMAAVIRAMDTQLERQVALKILPPDMAGEPENVKRFENEARAAAKLDHENIARVFFYGCDQNLHFIAFEFVEGKNLRVLIEQQGRIPIQEAVHYILQIATGLVHAAERGVVHRDIKPSNIIVGETGRAKLVDMGLARSTGVKPSDALTQSGVTLGTFDYISPEQALEPRKADSRSDIYSLGCTFYHMVTGVPPVPDGTAARKLQFHQNEAPIDPRQLNGQIPDELAAILSKMMAKDPNERYQRPEYLVQHLLTLTRKLHGQTTPLTTNDVVFVDSILPSPPQLRPLWVLVIGGAALVLLIGVLGPLFNPEPSSTAPPSWAARPSQPTTSRASAPMPAPARANAVIARPLEPAGPTVVEAHTPSELQQAVVPRQVRTIRLDGETYDLTERGRAAKPLVFADGDFTIEGKNGVRPVLRFSGRDRPALVLESGIVTLRGLQFELDPEDDGTPLTALAVSGGQLVVEDCEFREVGIRPGTHGQATALRVLHRLTTPGRTPSIFFRRCALGGGGTALHLEEGANITVEDCLLGPYQQPIVLGAAERTPHLHRSTVNLTSCAWLLGTSPGIQVDTQQPCQLTLTRNVISRPERGEESPLLLLAGTQTTSCKLTSSQNYLHQVEPLIVVRGEDGTLEKLATDLGSLARLGGAFSDHGSVQDSASPWEDADPAKRLAEGDVLTAGRVNLTLAALRPEPELVLGPRKLVGRELYRNLPPVTPAAVAAGPAAGRELVVDGVGSKPGTYKNLASALGDADAEVEIVIVVKLTGSLPVRSLDIGSRKVTIRAAEGFQPELGFNPDQVPTSDGEAILFRIHDGELNLEQLALRLTLLKERDATKLQALVSITGTGRCRLKNCVATLAEDNPARTGLIALADPTGAMMGNAGKPARLGSPSVELENCLVRGGGELLMVRVSRPFQMELRNVLAALNGSLLTVDGNKPEANLGGEGAAITLDRVTAHLTQSLVHLRASAATPVQVPLRVTSATSCVFVAALGNPLLRVDGPQSEDELKRRLTWQGRRNFYSPAAALLIWQPLQKDEMPHKYGSERWSELWGRSDDLPGFAQSIRFAASPLVDRPLVDVVPADFRILSTDPPETDLASRGAELDLLPLAVQNAANP